MEQKLTTRITDDLYYVVLSLLTTFFLVNRYLTYGMIALAGILLLVIIMDKAYVIHINKLLLTFMAIIGAIFIDLLLRLTTDFSQYINATTAIKEIFRVIVYMILLEILLHIKVSLKLYINLWRVILFFVVFVAFLQYSKLYDVNSLLIRIYGDSKQYYNTQYEEFSKFRCGSVFVNPNVFSCFLIAFLCCYLSIAKTAEESFIMQIITLSILFLGFLFSGSRTGILLSLIVLLVYLYRSSRQNVLRFVRNLLYLIVIFVFFVLVLRWVLGINLLSLLDSRMFQFEEGIDNSLGIKMGLFSDLIKEAKGLNFLFGFGPYDYAANEKLLIDFDIGYFLTYFGFIGAFLYPLFIKQIYNYSNTKMEQRKNLNIMFVIVIIVFGLTAGIYFNIRIFAIYMLMFLPALVQKGEQIS